jgi:hypothetical protein
MFGREFGPKAEIRYFSNFLGLLRAPSTCGEEMGKEQEQGRTLASLGLVVQSSLGARFSCL